MTDGEAILLAYTLILLVLAILWMIAMGADLLDLLTCLAAFVFAFVLLALPVWWVLA